MSERQQHKIAFLKRAGVDPNDAMPLVQDASARKYERIRGGAHVLMDLNPATGFTIDSFLRMTNWLASAGLHVPKIADSDPERGFVLLEDFGDDLVARRLERKMSSEREIYDLAFDVLAKVQEAPVPDGLPPYDVAFTLFEADLLHQWYCDLSTSREEDYRSLVEDAMARLPTYQPCVVLRDFHAENLFWLPDEIGMCRLGLIDYQDARAGHSAYDLASLLGDARRDVSEDVKAHLNARGLDEWGPEMPYATSFWGAQRNLKILGIFMRLAIRDGRRNYIDLLPRVWRNLQSDLQHDDLSALAKFVTDYIPPPQDNPKVQALG